MIASVDLPGCAFPFVSWYGGVATFTTRDLVCDGPVWAVVVFISEGDRFLIGNVPRGWCTPSGRIENGEHVETAARREVFEEVGATVRDLDRIGTFVTVKKDGTIECVAVFHGHLAAANAIPAGSESLGARTVSLDELPSIYWRWDPLMRRMFEYAHEISLRGPNRDLDGPPDRTDGLDGTNGAGAGDTVKTGGGR